MDLKDPLAEGPFERGCSGLFDARADLTGVESASQAANALNMLMRYDFPSPRDDAALLFRHEVTMDEIRDEVAAAVHGAERFPQELDAALCKRLFAADPAAVVAWGGERMLPGVLLRCAKGAIEEDSSSLTVRRLVRLTDGMAEIPGGKTDPPHLSLWIIWPVVPLPEAGWVESLRRASK